MGHELLSQPVAVIASEKGGGGLELVLFGVGDHVEGAHVETFRWRSGGRGREGEVGGGGWPG